MAHWPALQAKILLALLYRIIRSSLENRSFTVRHGNYLSSFFSVQAGVPQGSDLSPDLFNIITSDIAQTIDTTLYTSGV